MFSLPMEKISERIRGVLNRSHNMPEEMRRAALDEELERNWNEAMGKAETYVQGQHILEHGGYFSTMSLGNWQVLCEAAGVETVPSRVVAVINPVQAFDIHMNGVDDRNSEALQKIANGIQDIAPDEILRWDGCMPAAVKGPFGFGRQNGGLPAHTGVWRTENGTILPDLPDERVVNIMMENPENASPVWVRKWIEPVMMEGDLTAMMQARMLPQYMIEDGKPIPGEGNLFACEWRVFVKNGAVAAVGNYYPQIARGTTPEDEVIALAMAQEAKAAVEKVLGLLEDIKAVPHHPKYEMRDGLDPDGIHFTVDFLEVADDSKPHGRRLVMLEGGPAHLRNPNWGANPVSFGIAVEPAGIALSLTDIRPF